MTMRNILLLQEDIQMTNQLHLFKKVKPKNEVKQEEFDDTLEERLKNYNDLIKRFKSM